MVEFVITNYSSQYDSDFKNLNEYWLQKYFSIEPYDHQLLSQPQQTIISAGGNIWFALVAEKAVGTIAIIPSGDSYEIAKMAVHPNYQGIGIGKKLLLQAISAIEAKGVSYAYLLTSSKLKAANHLYNKLGFHTMPPTKKDRNNHKKCDMRWEYYFNDAATSFVIDARSGCSAKPVTPGK